MFVIQQEQVRSLGWPCPALLSLVRQDGSFAFYDTATWTERFTFQGSQHAYVSPILSFSGDGRWLVALGGLWDLAPTVTALTAGTSPIPAPVNRYSGRGEFLVNYLYAVAQDGQRALRGVGKDTKSPTVQQLLGLPGLGVQGVCPGPEPCPSYAAALSDRFVVWFKESWPPYKEALIYSLESRALTATLSHTQGINPVVFSRDGRQLATAGGGTVRVWDPESGECVRRFKGQRGNVPSVAWHPSGRFLAVSCRDETVRFWDVESGKELRSFAWGVGAAAHLAFSPDGLTVAAATPQAVVVWDVDV
jgi:WD40 repeat protein